MGQIYMSSKKSTTTQSKSFRFSKETADLIAFGAASHRCSQVQFLEFLVRQEKAKNEKESKLISYALARQNARIEKLDYVIDDIGSIILDFIFVYFNMTKNKEEAMKEMENFMKMHRLKIANGKKGFLRRMYGFEDEDVSWEQVQARAQELSNQRKSEQNNGGEK